MRAEPWAQPVKLYSRVLTGGIPLKSLITFSSIDFRVLLYLYYILPVTLFAWYRMYVKYFATYSQIYQIQDKILIIVSEECNHKHRGTNVA